MDKVLNYLALARKAGLCELGEEPVGAITRTGKGLATIRRDCFSRRAQRLRIHIAHDD